MIKETFSQCGVLAMGNQLMLIEAKNLYHVTSFELLTVLSSKDQSRLTDCDSQVWW